MMKDCKVFIDSDILLDMLTKRKPHYPFSNHIVSLAETGYFNAYTSALILANCHYIISRQIDKRTADNALVLLRSLLSVLPTTDKAIGESLNSGFKDFEDGIQYYTALNHGMDIIITRNISDYPAGSLKVFTPREIVAEMS